MFYNRVIEGRRVFSISVKHQGLVNFPTFSKDPLAIILPLFSSNYVDLSWLGFITIDPFKKADNSFLVFFEFCRSELAMLYNDRSVQENHHISATFSLPSRVSFYDTYKRLYLAANTVGSIKYSKQPH